MGISDDKKVDILLKEYDSLRAEITHRIGHRVSFLGLFFAVLGYTVFKWENYDAAQLLTLETY